MSDTNNFEKLAHYIVIYKQRVTVCQTSQKLVNVKIVL